jgi:hypothetical protein
MKQRQGDAAVSLQSVKNLDGYHRRSTPPIGFPFNIAFKKSILGFRLCNQVFLDALFNRQSQINNRQFYNSYKNQLVEKMPPVPSLWHARCCFEKK